MLFHPALRIQSCKWLSIQSAHRREQESKVVTSGISAEQRGQFLAAGIALTAFAVAAYFAYLGHPTEGAIICGADLVALVWVFIMGKKKANDELKEKTTLMKQVTNPGNARQMTKK